MARLFQPGIAAVKGHLIEVDGPEARHAMKVLRVREGDLIDVLNGSGQVIPCKVHALDKQVLRLETVDILTQQKPLWEIRLYTSLIKHKAMDWIIQKATELGAAVIQPIRSSRCVVDLADSNKRKIVHWRQTMIEAVKQCGNPWLPDLHAPTDLKSALQKTDAERAIHLVAALDDEAKPVSSCFDRAIRVHGAMPGVVGLWIGPEGDFTPSELNAFREAGFFFMTLGPHVLRSETAALAGLSVILQELIRRPVIES